MTALLADAPALPLHEAGKYVAAAYIVLLALVLVYVAIMAVRTSRTERELGELLAELDRREAAEPPVRDESPAQAAGIGGQR